MKPRCAKCGCQISVYAHQGDAYCWPCHPRIENEPRYCKAGHDLRIHGGIRNTGRGRTATTCTLCKKAYDRERAAIRRNTREGKP